MFEVRKMPGLGGEKYIPFEERTGNESIVYFTRDLSPEGLKKIYKKINQNIFGKVAVKVHTGEKNGPNIIPRPWVEELLKEDIPGATIIETNTYYEGDRYTTEQHRETLKVNGWTFAPVDITDEHGTALLPIKNGKWFENMSVGKSMLDYDSFVALTHFKGHMMGGFGGSNKNIGIGCADGREGKKWIHTTQVAGNPGDSDAEYDDNMWSISEEELMERMTESTKATIDYFENKITYVNVMRNMSVDCDCAGVEAAPVVTPNVGILGSLDILALDQACVDLIWAMKDEDNAALKERIITRHGLRQLSYMKELGMGNDRYILIDLDNDEVQILPKEAVAHVAPFVY